MEKSIRRIPWKIMEGSGVSWWIKFSLDRGVRTDVTTQHVYSVLVLTRSEIHEMQGTQGDNETLGTHNNTDNWPGETVPSKHQEIIWARVTIVKFITLLPGCRRLIMGTGSPETVSNSFCVLKRTNYVRKTTLMRIAISETYNTTFVCPHPTCVEFQTF